MSRLTRRAYLGRGAVAVAASLGVAGCAQAPTADSGGDGGTNRETVAVGPGGDFVFEPGTESALSVGAGTTVRWVWKSGGHNIVVGSQPDGAGWQGTPGDAGTLYDEGYTYERAFDVGGTYHYWCQPHRGVGMVADLVVEE